MRLQPERMSTEQVVSIATEIRAGNCTREQIMRAIIDDQQTVIT